MCKNKTKKFELAENFAYAVGPLVYRTHLKVSRIPVNTDDYRFKYMSTACNSRLGNLHQYFVSDY